MRVGAAILDKIGVNAKLVIGKLFNINSNGTLDVAVRGTVVGDLTALNSYAAPAVGDNVAILSFGSTSLVLGAMGNAALSTQVFTASGTWTKGPGAMVRVICIGAGGGGGGSSAAALNQSSKGGGGGAGGYSESWFAIGSLPDSVAVTVGTGGTGAASSNGTAGTASTFGSLVNAFFGVGGLTASPASSATPFGTTGGNGASVGTGQIARPGSPGGPGFTSGSLGFGGQGGGDGGGNVTVTATAGLAIGGMNAIANSGGGGGGALSTSTGGAAAGGNGADGVVVVQVF